MKLKRIAPIRAIFTAKWLFIALVVLFILFQYVVLPNSTAKLAVYKLMLGIAGAIVGHIVVKALYPYMSLSKMLEEDKTDEMPDAVKFLGACILRGAVMAAIIIGVLTGI
jgi:hypothetical protein